MRGSPQLSLCLSLFLPLVQYSTMWTQVAVTCVWSLSTQLRTISLFPFSLLQPQNSLQLVNCGNCRIHFVSPHSGISGPNCMQTIFTYIFLFVSYNRLDLMLRNKCMYLNGRDMALKRKKKKLYLEQLQALFDYKHTKWLV